MRKAFRSFLRNVMISSALWSHVSDQSAGLFLAADDDRCHLALRRVGLGPVRRRGAGNVTSGRVVDV